MAEGRAVPRRWRLSNPPAAFTGRGREVEWLRLTLTRAPLAVLSGPPGVGKTALLRGTFASLRDQAVVVSQSHEAPPEQAFVEVMRALAEVLGRKIDLAVLQSDLERTIDVTLELLAAHGGLVVVDGLALREERAIRWVGELAAHAEPGSQLLVVSRAPPPAGLAAGQHLALGPMAQAPLRELAATWAPQLGADAHLRACRIAHGNPGALLVALHGGAGPAAAIDDGDRRLLRMLAVAGPLPPPLVDALGSADARERLLGAGLLRSVGDAIEPWDRVAAGRASAADLERGALALVLAGGVDGALAAIAMLAAAGASDRVLALLEERGAALLANGYAARLWAGLGEAGSPELEGWQLRCAAQLGNPTVLALAHEPGRDTPEDRLAWAGTLLARGKPDAAIAHVSGLTDAPGRLGALAALIAAEAHARAGDPGAACATLDTAGPGGDESLDAELALARARWAHEDGQPDAPPVAPWAKVLGRLDAREEAWRLLAEAAERRGELDLALEAVDAMESRPRGARPELLASRLALMVRARVAVERGEPELALGLLEVVRPYAREPSALAGPVAACELAARLVQGTLAGFEEQLALARRRSTDALTVRALESTATSWARAHGTEPPQTDAVCFEGRLWRARWSRPGAAVRRGPDRRTEVYDALVEASAALAQGRALDARAAAQRARVGADRWGLRGLALHAASIECEALASAAEPTALRATVEDLRELAAASGSARFDAVARFFRAVAGGRVDPAAAEVLAAQPEVSPTVARWCRVILGGDAPLDHADRALLEALRASGALGTVTRVDDGAPSAGAWGVDVAERAVWRPSGERVSLAGRPTQWKILEVLASRPGLQADKESLVCAVWGVEEYHPGKHDGRLYVAIRKLRSVLEDDPSAPTRLVTVEDGYALGAPVRVAR